MPKRACQVGFDPEEVVCLVCLTYMLICRRIASVPPKKWKMGRTSASSKDTWDSETPAHALPGLDMISHIIDPWLPAEPG